MASSEPNPDPAAGTLVAGAKSEDGGAGSKSTVLVADPQALVGEALARVIDAQPNLFVLDQRPVTGLDALDLILSKKPDVSVVDYWMPDMEGSALVRMIRARQPERKIVLLSWFHGSREADASRAAGAIGFLPKSFAVQDLVTMVGNAADTNLEAYLKRHMRRAPNKRKEALWARLTGLSRRQVEIVSWLGMDTTPEEVAAKLGISPHTVLNHTHNVLAKTGYATKKAVVAAAREVGLIRN